MDRIPELDGSGEGLVGELLRDATPKRSIDEANALGSLRRNMFGRRSAPITLSRYRLLGRLGAGGTGVVYEAWDPKLERKVAIKVLHPSRLLGRDDSRARARLLREAQALASLSHPNVVPVYDVGSYGDNDSSDADGSELPASGVFVVMELIDGMPMDQWVRGGERSWESVVDVFVAAGRGLAAAHARGLVHRDFKPANVLVGRGGRVRVLDFGLARVEASAETEPRRQGEGSARGPVHSGPITITGSVMGTPAYMAPEQHRGTDVDHRSDQFSFCVALYEALYGSRPFEGVDTQQLELAKLDERVRPTPEAAAVPAKVERALLRGLRKDPAHRFSSMNALLAELLRARRGRRRSAIAMASVASLVVATVLGVVAWRQHHYGACLGQQRLLTGVWDRDVKASVRRAFDATGLPFSVHAWTAVEHAIDDYSSTWVDLRTSSCEAALVRNELPRARMERTMLCLDRRLKSLGEVTGLLAQADREVVGSSVRTVSKLPSLEPCRVSEGVEAHDDATELDRESLLALDAQLSRGEALLDAARFEEALSAANAALVHAAADPQGRSRAHLLAGRVSSEAAWFARAEEHLFDAFIAAEEVDDHGLAARALIALAHTVGVEQSRLEEGERYLRQAELKLRHHGLGGPLDAAHTLEMARLRLESGRSAQAVELFEQALARYEEGRKNDLGVVVGKTDDLLLASVHQGLAAAHYRNGDYARGTEQTLRVLELRRTRLGEDHPGVASALDNLGVFACATNDFEASLDHYRRALAIRRAALPADHPDIGSTLNNIGVVYARTDRYNQSLKYFRDALDIWERVYGPQNPTVVMARSNIAELLVWSGDYQAAFDAATDALGIARGLYEEGDPQMAQPRVPLGLALLHLGQPDEAVAHFSDAIAAYEATHGQVHPKLATPLRGLGLAYLANGDFRRAVSPLQRAVALEREYDDRPAMAEAQFALARALWPTHPRKAKAVAEEAREVLNEIPTRVAKLAEVEAWLADR